MFGLDKIAGGALGMVVPGGDLIVKGLELLKGLLGNKDLKGAEDVLNLLTRFLQKTNSGQESEATPGEAQPFTPPKGFMPGATMEIEMRISAPSGKPVPRAPLPLVDGSPAGDQMLSQQAGQFMEGSEANKAKAMKPGSNDWTTIMWAMQGNPNVHYNADTQRFFAKTADGGKIDLGSLDEMKQAAGSFDRSNPVGQQKINDLINQKLGAAAEAPSVSTVIYRITTQASKPAEAGEAEPPAEVEPRQRDSRIAQLEADMKAYQAAQIVMRSHEVSITTL